MLGELKIGPELKNSGENYKALRANKVLGVGEQREARSEFKDLELQISIEKTKPIEKPEAQQRLSEADIRAALKAHREREGVGQANSKPVEKPKEDDDRAAIETNKQANKQAEQHIKQQATKQAPQQPSALEQAARAEMARQNALKAMNDPNNKPKDAVEAFQQKMAYEQKVRDAQHKTSEYEREKHSKESHAQAQKASSGSKPVEKPAEPVKEPEQKKKPSTPFDMNTRYKPPW
jgi:hypothetical protein